MAKAKGKMVRIYPVPNVSIPPTEPFDPPIRPVEQDVSEEVWEQLSQYSPPAFTLTAPPAESPVEGALGRSQTVQDEDTEG